MTPVSLPLPPVRLAARVGTVEGAEALRFYLDEGVRLRAVIGDLLPSDWSWSGKRVLDFGCGSARVLRHFAEEAETGEFSGCDIDAASVDWDRHNLSPPFHFFRNELAPPLTLSDHGLDLIWAMSVFTHIADLWSEWLIEMHRLLAPDGILIASFLGDGMWEPLVGEPYSEDRVGMTVLRSWDGPEAQVFHSEWWLREHWGRAFDVLEIVRPPRGSDDTPQITHSYIVLRRRDVDVGHEGLEQIDPGERREIAALQTSLRLTRKELVAFAARERDSPVEALQQGWNSLNRRVRRQWAVRRPAR